MIRHAATLLAYDNTIRQSEMTKEAVESLMAQDIGPLEVLLIDNGSSRPETSEYFHAVAERYKDGPNRIHVVRHEENQSPVVVSNHAMQFIFDLGHDKVLNLPNDVVIPPQLYREFSKWPRGIVTGSESREREFVNLPVVSAVSENTPMAVGLVRRWFYEALVAKDGYYMDEGFFFYASDCDMALRMAACGVRGVQLDIQYYHYGSASWRLLPIDEGQRCTAFADIDREYFKRKWGHAVDAYEYGKNAGDINFRGEHV